RTGRGERNSAHISSTITGAPMPSTRFHGNSHIAKPQSASDASAAIRTMARMMSRGVRFGRLTPGTASGASDMLPVYSAGAVATVAVAVAVAVSGSGSAMAAASVSAGVAVTETVSGAGSSATVASFAAAASSVTVESSTTGSSASGREDGGGTDVPA